LEVELKNVSSSDLLFENDMPFTFYDSSPVFQISAGESKIIKIKTLENLQSLELKLVALGAFSAPKVHPVIEWRISIDK
jgi:hypothetical protein